MTMLERAIAASGGIAVDMDDANWRAVFVRQGCAARALGVRQHYVIVAVDGPTEVVGRAACRLKVRTRTADKPHDGERRIGIEHIVVTQRELQQQVRIRVTAHTDPNAGAVILVVGDEIRTANAHASRFGPMRRANSKSAA